MVKLISFTEYQKGGKTEKVELKVSTPKGKGGKVYLGEKAFDQAVSDLIDFGVDVARIMEIRTTVEG